MNKTPKYLSLVGPLVIPLPTHCLATLSRPWIHHGNALTVKWKIWLQDMIYTKLFFSRFSHNLTPRNSQNTRVHKSIAKVVLPEFNIPLLRFSFYFQKGVSVENTRKFSNNLQWPFQSSTFPHTKKATRRKTNSTTLIFLSKGKQQHKSRDWERFGGEIKDTSARHIKHNEIKSMRAVQEVKKASKKGLKTKCHCDSTEALAGAEWVKSC